jgi:uncharacterized membrane protein YvlD (DUF360 family)
MKKIIRTFLFTAASLYITYLLMRTFDFGGSDWKTTGLLILAVGILYLFIRPVLAIVSMPNKGILFFFLCFLITGVLFYILTIVLPSFVFKPTTLPGIIILGYNLPSKDLNSMLSLVFSALTTSLVYLFLESLSNSK